MRILIIQFSGTGNTSAIANILCDEFQVHQETCEFIPMEDILQARISPNYSDWDIIGIGFPVHAMDAPIIVYDFLKTLPAMRKDYFLFKTAGSSFASAGSTFRIRDSMAKLGYRLKHEQLYVMPPNSFGTAKPAKVEKRYEKCIVLARQSASEILAGIRNKIADPPLRGLLYAFAGLEKYGAVQSSKHWKVNSDCTSCGLCAKQCPTQNITLENGSIRFADDCLLCLRCWWNCPVRAISHSFLKPFFLREPYQLPDYKQIQDKEHLYNKDTL